jgi:glycosyltransferase involved in cell wall biosynthesis
MKPLVSVGLPVYNGEAYLSQSLDSLLAQDYENIEFIISDNGSTDRTHEICRSYVLQDRRIRYYQIQRNMGAAWNFDRVFELSNGEYFMWATHDDYWHPSYLSSCLEAFGNSKELALAGTICIGIDSTSGKTIFVDEGISTVGLSPMDRFKRYKSLVHSGKHIGGIFYGVYKRKLLNDVMPLINTITGDHLVLAKLSLEGEFITIQKPFMTKRCGGTSNSVKSIARVLGITNRFVIMFPYLEREFLLQNIIFQTDKLTFIEKLRLSLWSFREYLRLEIKLLLYRIWVVLPAWSRRPAKRVITLWRGTSQKT